MTPEEKTGPLRAADEADATGVADPVIFRREVIERFRPVILRGAFRDWPITRAAATSRETLKAYLLRFANGTPAQAFIGDRAIAGRYYYSDDLSGFNFQRIDMDVSAALRRIWEAADRSDVPSVYLGSLPTETYLPGFARDNPAPMLSASNSPRIWIGNASNVSCHYDTFDNLACVVAGRRIFTLYPPDAIANLYVGPIDHTMAGPPVGMAAAAPPGDPRYPRFAAARAKALVADLGPGDALYLPKLWWHQVEATADINILVNYWWDEFSIGPDAPFLSMLMATICIGERPPEERAAWRAFFDHYVFRPNGHPLAHLPEEQRGILGRIKDGSYGRIRAMVMQMLRGS